MTLLKYSAVLDRLALKSEDNWGLYKRVKAMQADGQDVIEMIIGEPDIPTPQPLIDATCEALENRRTGYCDGAGSLGLRRVLADRYTQSAGRPIAPDNVLCFPGTQTALYAVVRGIAGLGDKILVGDPMYATYEGVFTSSGATFVPVPLKAENDFRISARDIETRITEKTTAIFINTPHNPTGAVLRPQDIEEIGALAQKHDLWLLSDEVYDEMVFEGSKFASPLEFEEFSDRTIVVCSISKSHAAPGFRSGWCIASQEFCDRLLPLSENMLFGNPPFIADATAMAVSKPSDTAKGMIERFSRRAGKLREMLHSKTALRANSPQAGMFLLVDVSATGMTGDDYAEDLLDTYKVGVMPGSSFGPSLKHWVRISLTKADDVFDQGCEKIIDHANDLERKNGA